MKTERGGFQINLDLRQESKGTKTRLLKELKRIRLKLKQTLTHLAKLLCRRYFKQFYTMHWC